jgi:MoaA/NifB/PqqE/SkfB family radical SAM enzyme
MLSKNDRAGAPGAQGSAQAGQDGSAPAPESRWHWLRQVLAKGGPGQVIFALTNACNANCGFCNFALERLPRAEWQFAPFAETVRAIDVLHGLFIRYLIVTGGEPLLHPRLDDIVAYAHRRGLTVILVTNGSRLTEARCRELTAAGVSSVVISVDAADAKRHEANRQLPGVCEKIHRATRALRDLGVQATASVTVSRLVEDEGALLAFLRELGFDTVTFSYPLTALPSSFRGYAASPLVEFEAEELVGRFERIKALKARFAVVNPAAALADMQRLARGEAQRFACLGGYRYFYLDWELKIWRCHHWHEPLGSVFELDESKYVRDGCTRCMVDCFRDASVMQHVAVSVSDALGDLRAGRLFRAFAHLFRRTNVDSLRAVLGNRRWVSRL